MRLSAPAGFLEYKIGSYTAFLNEMTRYPRPRICERIERISRMHAGQQLQMSKGANPSDVWMESRQICANRDVCWQSNC
jgi:hypothetical protein